MAKFLLNLKNAPSNMFHEQLFSDRAHLETWIQENGNIIINPKLTATKLTFELIGHTEENPNICEGTISQKPDDFSNNPQPE